LGTQLKPNKH